MMSYLSSPNSWDVLSPNISRASVFELVAVKYSSFPRATSFSVCVCAYEQMRAYVANECLRAKPMSKYLCDKQLYGERMILGLNRPNTGFYWLSSCLLI